jgi:hypothetical protein
MRRGPSSERRMGGNKARRTDKRNRKKKWKDEFIITARSQVQRKQNQRNTMRKDKKGQKKTAG